MALRDTARRSAPPPPPAPDEIDQDTGEIRTGPAAASTSTAVQEFARTGGDAFEVVKYVSVPMLTTEEVPVGRGMICQMVDAKRILPPMEGVARKIKGDHHASTIKAPNGEVRLFTWSEVFTKEMEGAYPNESYVGRWFQITRLKKTGKDYWTFAINEVKPRAAAGRTIDAGEDAAAA